jgi:protein lifeguard
MNLGPTRLVSHALVNPGKYINQDHEIARLGFVQKIFAIVLAQLVITSLVCCFVVLNTGIRQYTVATWNERGWHTVASIVLPTIFLIMSFAWQHRHPLNMVSLFLFTLSSAWSVARMCAVLHEMGFGWSIAQAALLTTLTVAGLTLFALQSKRDFSYMRAGLFVTLLTFSTASTIALIFQWAGWSYPHLFHHAAGVTIFSLYIIFDVQQLSTTMSVDDYIPAAISVYIDILNLFVQFLSFLVEMALRHEEEKKDKK